MNRFILMAVAFIAIAGPASAGINDGLIGHWPFDGDATDATGNGHNGAVSGAALTADRDGNPNSAYQFASGNHIVVPHDAQLNLAGNATIALWMNQQNTYWGAAAVALAKVRDVTAGTYIIWRVPGFSATDIIFTTRQTNPADGGNPIAPLVYDEWHHITAIIDGDNQTQRIYLDGVLASSEVAAYYPWAANNTSPLVFGRHYTCANGGCGAQYPFFGKLDDIRIYDRALPDCEIAELAGTGSCNTAPDASGAVASIGSLWPPNNKMVDISIEGVTDADGDEVTIAIDSISDDEGSDSDDAVANGDTASLRAQRDGKGDGRTYTIEFTVDDGKGGTTTGSVTVEVPHDQGSGQKKGRGKLTTGAEATSWGAIKKSID